ncbi:hypothetical protein C1645_875723 [Glomus cerebriforme]|uniref:C2H2-type domain-containing protein n=1 Tax=Glomus cerebriforme TaxID=658196 RepID=A0A397SZF5_9GLOM|nr:hypothetical protein C1645_875723 [Glomus cerebriforme]
MSPVANYNCSNIFFINMSSTNIGSTTLTTSFITFTSEFFCSACQKSFKKQSGLSRHLTTVKKYNIPRNSLDRHIHHRSNRNVYKCVFRGVAGYQALSEIFNNPLWGQKFYDKE